MEIKRGYGVIPYRKKGGVDTYEWLLIQHTEGHWGFPKGHAEDNETPLETAKRELREETGIAEVRIDHIPPIVSTYSFVRDGVSIHKTVTYFLGEVLGDQKLILQESEIRRAEWLSYDDAVQRLNEDVTTKKVRSLASVDVLTRAHHSLIQYVSNDRMESPLQQSHPYLHVGTAYDLSGKDRIIYRSLEIMPGFLSIITLLGIVALSFLAPRWAAYFTIVFSLYWLLKTIYLSAHLQHNFRRLKHNMKVDWTAELRSAPPHGDIHHLILLPCYREGYEVILQSVRACADAEGDSKKRAIVLALEERSIETQLPIAERIQREYRDRFLDLIITVHPRNIPGEIPGKGSNISYAAAEAKTRILDARGLSYERVIVSAFDIDTVVYPKYFECLTWYFVTAERPHHVSFQPVPLFNNNIWNAPMLSRVLAYSSTFWQMIQQERPEKLATFSSHALSFHALLKVGYWQKNIVSEDSRIFWNLFIAHDGDYSVIPISYPVSMDANVAPQIWETTKNLYKQHRRWTWGVENVPYILFNFMKNPRISFAKKFRAGFTQVEGFWSLVTNPLILFLLGWLPLLLGGREFNTTVLSYNLPILARFILTIAMSGLIVSAAITMTLMPERPKEYGWRKSALVILQWVLVPFTMIVFSAIPGLDAQIRLMVAKYMGFWVTPKTRGITTASS